ncbi:FAD/NAD(P)-binding protein [Radicibacter daui]|uniref:FAD/NAD(P)-binding protein n=1 Tax=Radicibacter daui TaxID=3064829 RepID=UPI004046FF52
MDEHLPGTQARRAGELPRPVRRSGEGVSIAVVGGGFTAAAVIAALARSVSAGLTLQVFEPSGQLGKGLAYGRSNAHQLLNSRALNVGLDPTRPRDFIDWLLANDWEGAATSAGGGSLEASFVPREAFGRFVNERLLTGVAAHGDLDLRLFAEAVTAVHHRTEGFDLTLASGAHFTADIVMLATGYGSRRSAGGHCGDVYDESAYEGLPQQGSVAFLGTGLSMIDGLLTLRRQGFQGAVTAISRRGLLPRPHARTAPTRFVPDLAGVASMSAILHRLRQATRQAEAQGEVWQSIIDGLRPHIAGLWQALDGREQARFLRHLRAYWNVHRHRVPPQIGRKLEDEVRSGALRLVAGRVSRTHPLSEGGLGVIYRPRSTRLEFEERFDAVFDCRGTAPDTGGVLERQMVAEGLLRRDPHNLGFYVDATGRARDSIGAPADDLFALGPLGQGSLLEVTAIGEIVAQADRAARHIAALIAARRGRHRGIG